MQSFFSRPQLAAVSLAFVSALVMPLAANAQTFQNVDTAPNDQFSDRVTIEPGVTRLFGQLDEPDSNEFVYTMTGNLEPGEVDIITVSDLPPSEPIQVFLEISSDRTNAVMGLFDNEDNLVTLGYGSYPYGAPYPAITSAVPVNGTLNLKVSGGGDDDLDGMIEYYDYYTYCEDPESCEPFAVTAHGQSGEYTVSVLLGHAQTQGDVDYFTLSGLTPGHVFTISETARSEYGLRIGWMASDGTLIGKSSYVEFSGREQLGGIVPASGEVHLVVSAYEDYDFQGTHSISQDYLLEVETRPQ